MRVAKLCILGGSGFVGRSLASRLISSGRKLRVITRSREDARGLWVLPGLELIEGDVYDSGLLGEALQGCDALVNLVGILNERKDDGAGFKRAHVELAQRVVDACRTAGVRRLLHMSALNADPRGSSHYLRTKGEAENRVHAAEGLAVTSFRPSVIFGPQDSFINRFAGLLKLMPGAFPLACAQARFAPVYVGDVAQAMLDALDEETTFGKRIELCGPKEYRLLEIVRYIAQVLGLTRIIVPLPVWASRLQAEVLEHFPGKPFSRDNYRSLSKDNTCSGSQVPCLTFLESVVPAYLGRRPTTPVSTP